MFGNQHHTEYLVMASSAEQLAELQTRRDAGTLSPHALDLNFLSQLNDMGDPLRRKDMDHATGPQAVVLNRQEFDTLGFICFVHASGEEMTIDADSMTEDALVIFPEEVG